ncbi:unnamed protein product [Dovyalis caffra]|uniref:RNA helicase n=1 Tax=Dovyalis caffra TaxID=77055 RepID=A0AAV1RBQ1_9ROSI|nr:unnamed protein product [Dovyalis caffra]
MLLYRSPASMLHSYKLLAPPLPSPLKSLSHLKHSYSFLSSPLQIRLFFLNPSTIRGFATAAVDETKTTDTFFADHAVSWSSLGLSHQLPRALSEFGLSRPSLVQAAAIPSILSGKDVVIAAETGSGKTHSYLVPLINNRLSASTSTSEPGLAPTQSGISLVLCPNVLLCDQVVKMASGLCDDNGHPLLTVAAVCGRQGWPVNQPDIIVSTPAALLNNIDLKKQSRSSFISCVKYVVFDEADMLLCGGFQNQVIRLINMLRFDEKQLSRANKSAVQVPQEAGSGSLGRFSSEDEEDLQNEPTAEQDEDFGSDLEVEDLKEETEAGSIDRKDWRRSSSMVIGLMLLVHVGNMHPWLGRFGCSFGVNLNERWLVTSFIGLTASSVTGYAQTYCDPPTSWPKFWLLSYSSTEQHPTAQSFWFAVKCLKLEQKWVEVSVDTQVDALIEALNQGLRSDVLDYGVGVSRTMVFANTVEAVEAVCKILSRAGIGCFCYHKDCSLEERAKTLADFREKGGIFVCTDAAARGVDIPNVSHVIQLTLATIGTFQADFATSAVDFLHRVGRTARAGQHGLVTSLYTESNKDLVDAIRQAEKLGRPVVIVESCTSGSSSLPT